MPTIKEIYNHTKQNNKPLLMTNAITSSYPTIEGATTNFVTDYLANYSKYDRMFCQLFMSKKAIFIDDKDSYPAIYNEWIEACNDFILYYMDVWAYLYFSLNDPANSFNPIDNYNGTTETHTKGKVEGLSGNDITSNDIGARRNVESLGEATSINTNYAIPYDTYAEKETDKSATTSGAVTNTNQTDAVIDISTLTHGKTNNVDYIVTEHKHGNLGVTTTAQMIAEFGKLKPFWDSVFHTLANELTIWEVD